MHGLSPRGVACTLVIAAATVVAAAAVAHARPEPPDDRQLFAAQREVWQDWFAGDTARLRTLTPGLIAINNGDQQFRDQEQTIRGSAEFHAAGGRLLSLEFPELRVQHFGNVAILYSRWATTTLFGSDTTRRTGRATEVFVRVGGKWVNPGWHLDSGS